MSDPRQRKVYWLVGVAALLAAANVADFLFSDESSPRKDAAKPPASGPRAEKQLAKAAPVRPAESVEALRERLAYLRSVEHAEGQIRATYAKFAVPYAEAMSVLPTFFSRGKDPKVSLEAAIRDAAKQHGLAVDSLLVAVPERTGPGTYEGVATLAVHAGDSEAMLRFLAEAGRPGSGMVWNGFQLSADAQKKQVSLAGELRSLLVEAAE